MLCPEILPAVQTWPIILVSIFLCLSLKSGFLGHTSLLASNVSPRARGWRFYSAFPLQLSVVIVQSLHHLNSVRSLCRAKYSNNKQTSPGFLAFILLSKEKTEKAIVSLSTHGRSHVSHKWVTCAGKSLLALIDWGGWQWYKATLCQNQGDDGSIALRTAESKGTDTGLKQALLCVSDNHRVTGGFCY